MSRTYPDIYHRIGVRAENNVAKKFSDGGVEPFPEVDLGKASFISGIPERRILYALRNRKLRGRRVGNGHMIRVVDLWYFAVSLESARLIEKNHR